MKKLLVSLLLVLVLTYTLTGLQSSLYFLPFPAPALWLVVFCYVSFYRPLFTALIMNVVIALIVCQFTALNIAPLVTLLGVLTLTAKAIQDRFRLDDQQVILSIGLFCLAVNIGLNFLDGVGEDLYRPHFWGWLGQALSTALAAPLVFYPILKLDQYFYREPIDHLEQLFA